jgi:hypothetical protein
MRYRNQIVMVGVVAASVGVGRWTSDWTSEAIAQPANGQPETREYGSQPADPKIQEMMKKMQPGPEHKVLDGMLGSWECQVKMWMEPGAEPMEITGSATRSWTLNGRFIEEHVDGDCPEMGPFQGLGYMGFNTIEKKYETVWLEDKATWVSNMTGTYDAAKKTFTFEGENVDPMTGKAVQARHVIDVSNPSKHIATGYCTKDGKEFKNFEGVFEKR